MKETKTLNASQTIKHRHRQGHNGRIDTSFNLKTTSN